jgi:hypothetical protein
MNKVMEKETLYKWIIAILLLINCIQLGGFLLAPRPPERANFKEKAVRILDLNPKQKDHFFKSAEKHRLTIDSLNREQKRISVSQFNNPSGDKLNMIKEIEIKKIKATQINFDEIKAILTGKQLSNFEEFKKQALQIILR